MKALKYTTAYVFLFCFIALGAATHSFASPISLGHSITNSQGHKSIQKTANWITKVKKKLKRSNLRKIWLLLSGFILSTILSAGFFWGAFLLLFSGNPIWAFIAGIIFAVIGIVCFVFFVIELVNM